MKLDLCCTLNSGPQNPLLIPEIAQWIYHLSPQQDGYHLARTCSHLFNSLIPLVWENVNGVEQLLVLIANTNISIDAEYNIDILITHNVLSHEDLTRFRFYAPFVRRLVSFKIEKYSRYQLRGWKQLLAGLGGVPLLPNLRTLVFNTRPTTTMFEQQTWFLSLLSPSLQELSLMTTSSSQANLNGSAAKLFFRAVSATLLANSSSSNRSSPPPNKTISISTLSDDEGEISWPATVWSLANLSKLVISMSTLNAGQLSAIGLLPQLESLELDFDFESGLGTTSSYTALALDLPDHAFPRIRHFGLTNLPDTASFHALWSLKPLVSQLTSVTLHYNKFRWMSVLTHDEIMSNFISPMVAKSPSLVDLAIRPPEYEWNEAESSAPMFSLLAQLPLIRLRFAPMVPLHLSIPQNMGKYPLLQKLELTTSWVEVADIKALAMVFPNLEYLAVQITIYPEDFEDTTTTPTSSQSIIICVLSVFLEEDPLWDRAVIGVQLSRLLGTLWPKARYLTSENDVLQYKFNPTWARTRLFN